MKIHILYIIIVAFSTIIMAQEKATNFTCNDCSGVPHDLFNTLDSGKIVVMVWVMPCGACTGVKGSYFLMSALKSGETVGCCTPAEPKVDKNE